VANTQTTGYYFAPPSHWPVVGSIALFFLATSAVLLFNGYGSGWLPFVVGAFTFIYMLFGWFGTVIRESEGGLFNKQVDGSFRWAMSWFIFSEVMFFAAFFGALFYARVYSLPWLSTSTTSCSGPTSRPLAVGRPRTARPSSRRCTRGASRRSTRCCCSPRA
jgi:cytochrome c oxidase subunit 3